MSDTFLPYGRQSIDDDDIAAVINVLRSDYLTTGPTVRAFEQAFEDFLRVKHAIACANGTAALHLAVAATGLGPGKTGIVPANTFMATANAVRYMGADVVFADIDPKTGLMTPQTLERAASHAKHREIGAVLPVHFAGHPAQTEALAEIAASLGAKLIEDSCHAVGSAWRSSGGEVHKVGAGGVSHAATFSFHPVKSIASGEGGMIVTEDDDLARDLRLLRNHGIERGDGRLLDRAGVGQPWYHEMRMLGFNYRLSDIHAALGLSQLNKIEQFIEVRSALIRRYDELLAPLAPAITLVSRPRALTTGWHLAVVRIRFDELGIDRADAMQALRDRGIGTQVHYIPVYKQPYYRQYHGDMSLPGAEQFYAQSLSLPLFASMTRKDVDRVVEALKQLFKLSSC